MFKYEKQYDIYKYLNMYHNDKIAKLYEFFHPKIKTINILMDEFNDNIEINLEHSKVCLEKIRKIMPDHPECTAMGITISFEEMDVDD